MSFADDVAAAKEKPRETADVRVHVNQEPHTFRITQMDGTEYATETLRHPIRADIPLDREFGYDVNSLTPAVLPHCAVRLDGDDEVRMSVEEWADLFAVLDGGGVQAFVNTIFTLNQFADAKAVEAAKKLLDGLSSI